MRSPTVTLSLALMLACTAASDIFLSSRNSLTTKIEEIIPKDARRFYNELSAEDKGVLEDVVQNHQKFPNVDSLLENLKGRSSILYEKATSVIKEFHDSMDMLSPDAKKFVDDLVDSAREIGTNVSLDRVKLELSKALDRWRRLGPDAREDLKNAFPVISGLCTNPIFRTLATTFLGLSFEGLDNPSVTLAPSIDDSDGETTDDATIEPPIIAVTNNPPTAPPTRL